MEKIKKFFKSFNFKLFHPKRDKKILKWVGIIILVLTVLAFWTEEISYYYSDDSYCEEDYSEEIIKEESECNVLGIALQGFLVTYITPDNYDAEGYVIIDEAASENIVGAIEEAEKNKEVKAIILEIDSYGGFPVAGEEVALALKRAKKHTVALIREGGLSAAYYAATGADIIFASSKSDVGSIGLTMSYLDNVEKNKKEGLTYNRLIFGQFKDAGDPDKPLTSEEKELFMRDGEILYQNFIKDVAENRNLDIAKVKELADGFSMLGQMALDNGLIDRIGGMYEVKEYLEEIIKEEVEVCW